MQYMETKRLGVFFLSVYSIEYFAKWILIAVGEKKLAMENRKTEANTSVGHRK